MLSFLNDGVTDEDFLRAHFESNGASAGVEAAKSRLAFQAIVSTRKRLTITSAGQNKKPQQVVLQKVP
jgi:hypothetical protein